MSADVLCAFRRWNVKDREKVVNKNNIISIFRRRRIKSSKKKKKKEAEVSRDRSHCNNSSHACRRKFEGEKNHHTAHTHRHIHRLFAFPLCFHDSFCQAVEENLSVPKKQRRRTERKKKTTHTLKSKPKHMSSRLFGSTQMFS